MEDIQAHINGLRHDFSKMSLDEDTLNANPFKQFEIWFQAAIDSKVPEPNAMMLSTVNAQNCPSSRIVLLRNFSAKGFVFIPIMKVRRQKILNSTMLFQFYSFGLNWSDKFE